MRLECKKCARCKETKWVEEFQTCKSKGRQVYCKKCKTEYAKEQYQKRKAQTQAAQELSLHKKTSWSSTEAASSYLAGLIDGEGTVACYRYSGIYRSRHIMVSNTEKDIIRACAEACDYLGITYSIKNYSRYHKVGNKKPEYRLHIYGYQNCKKVLEIIPIKATYKFEKLQVLVASFERSMDRRQEDSSSALDAEEVMLP